MTVNGQGAARPVACESPETHAGVWKGVGGAGARCLACVLAWDLDYRRTPATERELESIGGSSTRRCLELLHASGRITVKVQSWGVVSARPVDTTPRPLPTPEQMAVRNRQMYVAAQEQERMAREAVQRSSLHQPPTSVTSRHDKAKMTSPSPEPEPAPWERAGVPAIPEPPPPPPVLTTRDPGYWTPDRRREWAERTEAQRAAQRAARSAGATGPDGPVGGGATARSAGATASDVAVGGGATVGASPQGGQGDH
jgi:hypothetical protein